VNLAVKVVELAALLIREHDVSGMTVTGCRGS
jgi:hypothetical protein